MKTKESIKVDTKNSIYLQLIIIFLFLLIHINNLYSQHLLTKLVPQPRQAYIREEFSVVFSFSANTKIVLNDDKPALRQAMEFNRELLKRGFDTLQYAFIGDIDTLMNYIVLGWNDSWINQLLSFIPDQKIEVDRAYPGAEGYVIDVLPSQVIISGSDEQGLHYGIITFFQLMELSPSANMVFASRIIDAPEFPIRWFYYPNNFQVAANNDKLKQIWTEAASYKLNGSLTPDYKFAFISDRPKNYYDSLVSVRDFGEAEYIDFIPGVFSFGYSGDILYHNPNWASGLPVKNQKFYIEGDTARLVPAFSVALSNPGLENYNGNNFTGFNFIDDPGIKSFVDTRVKHSGKVSIRFENPESPNPDTINARLILERKVKPYTLYHMSAWMKRENLVTKDGTRMTAIGKKGITLSYTAIDDSLTTDWKKVDIIFNSLFYDTISIYWGTWTAISGKIWWDDLVFEEVPFVNMLRRPGTPLLIHHPILDVAYFEGLDYDSLYDSKVGRLYGYGGDYDSWHQPPTFRRKDIGKINNGDTLLFSYYHTVVIGTDQVMITMSDPDVYSTIEKEFKFLDSILKPKTYFMNHDEIRLMNWDYGDQSRGLTPEEILADNVGKCVDIIKRNNPNSVIWDWNDMFDEYHNAIPANYYLVNGDLTGSADLMSKEIGIANWNSGNHQQSLDFFSEKGFRQISAPYYDQDENNIRIWKEWTQNTTNFKGMIYTTWQNKYTHLKPFAEYAWNHAPYIYHYPLKSPPRGKLMFPVTIEGDLWDKGWALNEAALYLRTDTSFEFTKIKFQPVIGQEAIVEINLPQTNEYLQYYFGAVDNHNWSTKIPFGIDKYFELGVMPVGVEDVNKSEFKIFPNPVRHGEDLTISLSENIRHPSENGQITHIEIKDILGRIVFEDNLHSMKRNIGISTDNLLQGTYFIFLRCGNKSYFDKIIIY